MNYTQARNGLVRAACMSAIVLCVFMSQTVIAQAKKLSVVVPKPKPSSIRSLGARVDKGSITGLLSDLRFALTQELKRTELTIISTQLLVNQARKKGKSVADCEKKGVRGFRYVRKLGASTAQFTSGRFSLARLQIAP